MHDLGTTIVAVASPPGRGGVGCLRISGERVEDVARELFEARARWPRFGGRPRYGRFLSRDGLAIDDGYLVLFEPSSSYTGETAAELWTHGSPAILAELVEGAVAAGAVPAGPGEFTYRALRHGRLDLTQAEAVRDLIAARTLYQARIAFAQAEGSVSEWVAPLREDLEDCVARAEAAVEFVEESETHLDPLVFGRVIESALERCEELLAGFRTGRVVHDGATLALVGMPNAGKSSLFNRLLARDRAIVTEVAGTTRDTLEADLDLGGVPVRLVDTAGLREVTDPVEGEGVRRARRAWKEADLVLLVLDGSRPLEPIELEALERFESEPETERAVVVLNKCDLPGAAEREVPHSKVLRVSARDGTGIAELSVELREHLLGSGPLEDPIITDARHARALERAFQALNRAARARASGMTEELVLEDLREAMMHLGEIGGEFTTDDLYDRIFTSFCIGK